MQDQQRATVLSGGKKVNYQHDGLIVWDQKGLVIVWSDGHRSRLSWTSLREVCPCTECCTPLAETNNPVILKTSEEQVLGEKEQEAMTEERLSDSVFLP